jgi:hypothetical protein
VYAASAFPGALTITDVHFFDARNPGPIQPATYKFSLSTTSAPVGGLSTTLSDNIGPDNSLFASPNLSGSGDFVVDGTPFTYNPANGNLLLDIVISNYTGDTGYGPLFNDAGVFGGVTNRAFCGVQSGCVADGPALVTGFSSTTVPEPSTALLVAAGLFIAARLRRRRSA